MDTLLISSRILYIFMYKMRFGRREYVRVSGRNSRAQWAMDLGHGIPDYPWIVLEMSYPGTESLVQKYENLVPKCLGTGSLVPRYAAIELPTVDSGWSCWQGSGLLLLTADVEKIAELASTADGLYGMTRSCYGSGWFSPSSFQNRNFAIVAKKPKWQ